MLIDNGCADAWVGGLSPVTLGKARSVLGSCWARIHAGAPSKINRVFRESKVSVIASKNVMSRRNLHPRVTVDQAGRPLPPKKNLAF